MLSYINYNFINSDVLWLISSDDKYNAYQKLYLLRAMLSIVNSHVTGRIETQDTPLTFSRMLSDIMFMLLSWRRTAVDILSRDDNILRDQRKSQTVLSAPLKSSVWIYRFWRNITWYLMQRERMWARFSAMLFDIFFISEDLFCDAI